MGRSRSSNKGQKSLNTLSDNLIGQQQQQQQQHQVGPATTITARKKTQKLEVITSKTAVLQITSTKDKNFKFY